MVKTSPSNAGVRVQSLVGELRSLRPKNQNIKEKQYCNKFNKRLFKKMVHIKKNLKKMFKGCFITYFGFPRPVS